MWRWLFLIGWAWAPCALVAQANLYGISDPWLARNLARSLKNAPLDSLQPRWNLLASRRGYAEFALDSLSLSEAAPPSLFFHQGPAYFLRSFEADGLSAAMAHRARLESPQKPLPLNQALLNQRLRLALNHLQNEGYPFARFELAQADFSPDPPDRIWADLRYTFDPGPFIRIDSLTLSGNKRVSDRFVRNLIRIHPGDPYRHDRILGAQRILNNTVYFQDVPAPQVSFTPLEEAKIEIALQQRQSSRVDVLAGLLPPSRPGERFQFTGSLDLRLVSPAGLGEMIELFYNQLPGGSQQARARTFWPMIAGTPFFADGALQLLRQDEDFFNLSADAAAGYAPGNGLEVRANFRRRSSRLLDLAPLLADTTRLALAGGTRTLAGVSITYENLDYRLNPSSGWELRLLAGIGARTIERDRRLPESRYAALPETDPVREVEWSLHRFISLGGRHVLHLGQRAYWLGQNFYFRNDLLQTGGARSVRGFNENEFFTSLFLQGLAEYRFLLDRNAFLMGFAEAAYLEDAAARRIFRPRSMGIGMNYGTRAGILSIMYAVGADTNQPFQPARGKIHVGLVNLF